MKINWKEYFEEFKRVHGNSYIEYQVNPMIPKSGSLLFEDGWRYAKNVAGPEYPPPADPVKHLALIKFYWTRRRDVLTEKYNLHKDSIISLARTQQKLSAAIQMPEKVTVADNSTRVVYNPINFEEMTSELNSLKEEITYCTEMLENATIPKNDEVFSPVEVLERIEEIESGRQVT